MLCVIFVFSLLGVSHNSQSINIDQLIRNNIGSWVKFISTLPFALSIKDQFFNSLYGKLVSRRWIICCVHNWKKLLAGWRDPGRVISGQFGI